MGFNTTTEPLADGDVGIWSKTTKHAHGHIQVYSGGKWYSDFAQNNKSPWADQDGSVFTVYRY